jgi:iron(III) transport system substrate-binding protein
MTIREEVMRRKGTITIVLVLSLLLGACRTDREKSMETWLDQAGLQEKDSAESLYKKALEEDVLTIYTVSSRLMDVAETYEEQYPGLTVNVVYYRVEELVDQIKKNSAAQSYDCDIIFCTNGDGSLTENLIPNGLAYKYVPSDMQDKMRSEGNEAYLSVWKDRVYITDPSRSMISFTLFSMMEKYDDEMKAAYSEHFGTQLISADGESAAETYIRMLLQNGLQVVNDSDDIAAAIAGSDAENPAVGVMNASKLRMRDQGYSLMACYQMTPFTGVINPADIMIAGGSKNINAAKLFIRWILGESDGTGKGYQPFLQEGAWPARIDVSGGTEIKLDDIPAVYTDETFSADYREDFLQFWESCLSEYKQE